MSHYRGCSCNECIMEELHLLRRVAELLELWRTDQEPELARVYRALFDWKRFCEGEDR